MKKLTIYFLLLTQSLVAQKTNVQNEVSVKNAALFTFKYKLEEKKTNLQASEFFKPYIFYVNENNHQPVDYMMESFVLIDDYFQSPQQGPSYTYPYLGIYDENYLETYINDLFIRTKLPIIVNENGNQMGFIGEDMGSTLSYTIDNFSGSPSPIYNLTVEFDYKLKSGVVPDTNTTNIFIGWEYFDTVGNEIYPTGMNFSNWYDAYLLEINNMQNPQSQPLIASIPVPAGLGISSVKIHIIKYALESWLKIDNVIVEKNGTGSNLVSVGDRDFDGSYNKMTTKWEFDKVFTTSEFQYLFKNRLPLLTELRTARNNHPSSFVPPKTKIILTLPSFNYTHYATLGQLGVLKSKIQNFLNNIESNFDIWNTSNSGVEISGIYMLQEGLYDPNIVNFLEDIKDMLDDKKWKLYGSPYVNTAAGIPCEINTSYNSSIIDIFDVLWQQPNAFFHDHNRGYMDSHLLKYVNDFMSLNDFSVNIETNNMEDVEGDPLYNMIDGYGRVNDYFSYGEKYGFINYAKVFYDDSGVHFRNAYSDDESLRRDYDNLYQFIRKARKGVIINPEFETMKNNAEFHNWSGNYSTQDNLFSYSAARSFDVSVSSLTNFVSQEVPIKGEEDYILSVKAREISNDNQTNSALVGIIFYDGGGNIITATLNSTDTNLNTNFNNIFNSYFTYLDTPNTTNFGDYSIYFKAPEDAVKFKFYLKKNKTANLVFKNMKFEVKNSSDKFRPIFTDTGSPSLLKIENEYELGSNSLKLFYHGSLQHASTSEKISILPDKNYNFKVWVKEKLPIKTIGANNKALIAIETFNHSGVKTNTSLSGFQPTTINGVEYQYKYISNINQIWSEFHADVTFPFGVASIKMHLYNWYYDNDLYFDNISFELSTGSLESTNPNEINLLNPNNWTEKLPLIVSFQKPVFYKDLIDVSTSSQLKFTAKIRDTYTGAPNNDLIVIEFYDANYNLLTNSDISTSETNLEWSSFYKYWWHEEDSYFNINSWGCNNNGDDEWFNNQWSIHERSIIIPEDASFIRVSLHKLSDSNEDFLILNPKLVKVQSKSQKEPLINDQFALRN